MTEFGGTQRGELRATKDVFICAIRYATSIIDPCPPFGDELRTSAQEQVEFMLGDNNEEILVVIADEEIKKETRIGLCKIFSSFEKALFSLLSELDERKIMQKLSDVEWLCDILIKTDMIKDFVAHWADISTDVLRVVEDKKLNSVMWGLKLKLIEVTSKVLDAIGYGTVILPAPGRVLLVKAWLPYIRKMKPLLESMGNEEADFPYRMDDDLSQSIEGAIVSLVSALPSNSQAEILADWMNPEHVKYPDLSEAFEVWCYRAKSAKRRVLEALAESPLQFSASD